MGLLTKENEKSALEKLKPLCYALRNVIRSCFSFHKQGDKVEVVQKIVLLFSRQDKGMPEIKHCESFETQERILYDLIKF